MSNFSSKLLEILYMFDSINRAQSPDFSDSSFAAVIAAGEKSTPVAMAPNLAKERVESPKWHCKCNSV